MGLLLAEFSSLIEISTGLCIAFVVVESSKEYAAIIYNKVFGFPVKINGIGKDICGDIAVHKETIHSVPTPSLDIFERVEELKRLFEFMQEKTRSDQEYLHETSRKDFSIKGFSALCLFLFLLCCSLLVFIPFEETSFGKRFIAIQITLVLAALLVRYGCIYCFESNETYMNKVKARMTVIYTFSGVFILSMLMAGILISWRPLYSELLLSSAILLSAILPISNFVVCYLNLQVKAKKILVEINKKEADLIRSFDSIKKLIKELETAVSDETNEDAKRRKEEAALRKEADAKDRARLQKEKNRAKKSARDKKKRSNGGKSRNKGRLRSRRNRRVWLF